MHFWSLLHLQIAYMLTRGIESDFQFLEGLWIYWYLQVAYIFRMVMGRFSEVNWHLRI
jgi:hypothetical protein